MTAFNTVRFKVKPGREQDFLDAHAKVDRVRQLEQVDDDGLLVVQVEDDVSDHDRMVGRRNALLEWPDGPV